MNNLQPLACIVIDDEPPAREILGRYIDQLPTLQLQAQFGNAIEAMTHLHQHQVDLVFLDIQMPQLKGTEFLKALKNPPPVIFTTAHPEYAIEGFELDAVDYLLKPIRFDRFLRAVNKVSNIKEHKPADIAPVKEERNQPSFVYVRADRKMVKVMLNDIHFVESMKDYVKIFTNEQVIITKQSLNSVEAMLPEQQFVRTHRSFIVSLSKIRSYTHELIQIDNNEVPIGKLYRNEVLKMLS
ncbi:LytR/AlgR family response regulator transcription factor [Aridibaculum aurantiacum]|uniref:LytR/AlgR family response regulator transcription factor n=1 Tax=Aridibaculum aurantiacum TaxID=2810307 RepID=UPI001A960320|nr:LytTR family DNA-binding domain-containing protein [Aridibaculum aurantiacum]